VRSFAGKFVDVLHKFGGIPSCSSLDGRIASQVSKKCCTEIIINYAYMFIIVHRSVLLQE